MSTKKDLVDETGTRSLDPKHAPISLPARSFDIDELKKGFEKVAAGSEAKRPELIAQALDKAVAGSVESPDHTIMPGYERVAVENKVTGNAESTVVFNQKLAEEAEAAAAGAGGAGPADSASSATAGNAGTGEKGS